MTVLDRIMVAVALAAALWWALSRRHRPAALEALSFAALALALATLLVEGQHWQLVPWQVLALAIVTAAALRLPAGALAPLAATGRSNGACARPRGRRGRIADGPR